MQSLPPCREMCKWPAKLVAATSRRVPTLRFCFIAISGLAKAKQLWLDGGSIGFKCRPTKEALHSQRLQADRWQKLSPSGSQPSPVGGSAVWSDAADGMFVLTRCCLGEAYGVLLGSMGDHAAGHDDQALPSTFTSMTVRPTLTAWQRGKL